MSSCACLSPLVVQVPSCLQQRVPYTSSTALSRRLQILLAAEVPVDDVEVKHALNTGHLAALAALDSNSGIWDEAWVRYQHNVQILPQRLVTFSDQSAGNACVRAIQIIGKVLDRMCQSQRDLIPSGAPSPGPHEKGAARACHGPRGRETGVAGMGGVGLETRPTRGETDWVGHSAAILPA